MYPDEVTESISANWQKQTVLGRSAALSAYANTDLKTVNFSLDLHRDLLTGSFTHTEDSLKAANLQPNGIVLDFFAGSGTTLHATMQLNAEDGGHRKFIMVQLPEATDEKSEAYKAGYKNICEIGKERIRRA